MMNMSHQGPLPLLGHNMHNTLDVPLLPHPLQPIVLC